MLDPGFLGIDVGSVCISLALIDATGETRNHDYRFHRGKVRETLRSMLEGLGPVDVAGVALTAGSPAIIRGARVFDAQVALITGCRRELPDLRTIMFVGGEKFGLIRFDDTGAYRGARTNSSCAAGTGSFLDQQARRLGFADIEELARRALASRTPPPKISTRCAVFARTDLVHAQQAGYSLEEICDGLCRGLSQNIADTLCGGERLLEPVVFAGGVAQNEAVRKHLEHSLGVPLLCPDDAPILAARGVALMLAQERSATEPRPLVPDQMLAESATRKEYFFAPLDCGDLSDSPTDERRRFGGGTFATRHPVEVDLYAAPVPGMECEVYLGIDIGSTSTKAMLIDTARKPLVGFYTRTLGSPLTAVQAISEAIEDWRLRTEVTLRVLGAGTTGAGRKFIGAIVKADLVVDEITAHARAAYELDPRIDTIIEIGGQDAKFTSMRDGMVTFSYMNTVCAAGTGSFLEEQANRLGCDLSDYARRVRGVRAPLSSDRCAVFMERDINNFLAQGFSTEEILAAALYSVRENYLTKVARGAAIGDRIAFQGATARNEALVAAFRQGLGKPILVSRYCHLTGALGVALHLAEAGIRDTLFVGLAGLAAEIPVRSETCALCANHCRLRIATVGGETVAYGFLCGRDYDATRYVSRDTSGFNLRKERAAAFAAALGTAPGAAGGPPPRAGGRPLIGIPAALGLYGQLPLWKSFFDRLGVSYVTSEGFEAGIDLGREVQGAEFCAPIAALHGHVQHLRDRADWIFLPVLLEEDRPGNRDPRVYCYYTQFSSALASGAGDAGLRERCLMPQASWSRWRERTKRELHDCLHRAGLTHLTRASVSRAFEEASAGFDQGLIALGRRFRDEMAACDQPAVVLLGRPYNVLSPEMSKGIPEIFGSLGMKTFYQDMIPYETSDVADIAPLLGMVHWLHAARIMEVTRVVAETPHLYPVFITSFKCSPDSFALEYFKRIMDAREKPYLILQLDDHDSTLGYETRIEAGVAAFRNHARRVSRPDDPRAVTRRALPVVPTALTKLGGRTLLYPNWDPLVNPLLAANLRREGIDARVLEEDPVVIRKAMRHNTGQCLPLSIIAQETVDRVRASGLDPSRTAIWLPRSNLSCNLGMFTPFLKSLMEAEGGGMERVEVYAGDMYYLEISLRAAVNAYKAYLVGGLLRRVGCRLRPYETTPDTTDRLIARAGELLVPAFEGRASLERAIKASADLFDEVEISIERHPRVAIFGDLYARDNDVMNQGLIHAIEAAGGEAITTPYTEYVRIVIEPYVRKWNLAGEYMKSLTFRSLWKITDGLGGRYRAFFDRFLDPEPAVSDEGCDDFAQSFGLRTEHAGESFENLMKIFHLARAHPELALFVQASPAFCCPSMVTEAMARDIERITGVPIVSITYDGTGHYQNDVIVPYLRYAAQKAAATG